MVSDPNPNPVHLPAYDSVEDMDRRAVPVNKAAARVKLARAGARFRRANTTAASQLQRLGEGLEEARRLDEELRRVDTAGKLDSAAFYAAELAGKYMELAQVGYRAATAYRELGALMEEAGDG